MAAFADGLSIALTPEVLALIVLGTLIGMFASMIPGISGITSLAVLVPITFTMETEPAFAFLLASMGGAGFAGSITSILLNLPGEGTNAATTLDGYPMARQGRAGEALGASAVASALGAIIGVAILAALIPVVRPLLLQIGPAEIFAFTVAGIILIATVSRGNLLPGILAGLLGMLVGTIGLSVATGVVRFTGGSRFLFDGLPMVPVVIGLFAIPELIVLMAARTSITDDGHMADNRGAMRGALEVLKRPKTLIRSSVLGAGIGALPGVGGTVATWTAYFVEKNASRQPEKFGHGEISGVIAPEAANDAKDGGSLLPLFALGVPGSVSTAIILGAFLVHGVVPGRRMFSENLDLVWLVLISLVIANILTSAIGLMTVRWLVKITTVSPAVLAPVVLVLSLIGPYVDRRTTFAVILTVVFALIGLGIGALGYSRPAFVVGFILAPIAERNLFISVQVHGGFWETFSRPVVIGVLTLSSLAIAIPIVLKTVRLRLQGETDRQQSEHDDSPYSQAGGLEVLAPLRGTRWEWWFTGLLAAVAVTFLIWSRDFPGQGGAIPRIVSTGILFLAALRLIALLRGESVSSDSREDSVEAPSLPTPKEFVGPILWVISLPAVFLVFGMLWGAGLFAFIYYIQYQRQWTYKLFAKGALLGLVVAVMVHYVFRELLSVTLIQPMF